MSEKEPLNPELNTPLETEPRVPSPYESTITLEDGRDIVLQKPHPDATKAEIQNLVTINKETILTNLAPNIPGNEARINQVLRVIEICNRGLDGEGFYNEVRQRVLEGLQPETLIKEALPVQPEVGNVSTYNPKRMANRSKIMASAAIGLGTLGSLVGFGLKQTEHSKAIQITQEKERKSKEIGRKIVLKAREFINRPSKEFNVGNPETPCAAFVTNVLMDPSVGVMNDVAPVDNNPPWQLTIPQRVYGSLKGSGNFIETVPIRTRINNKIIDSLQPGDIVFFTDDPEKRRFDHISIYAGENEKGEEEVIHAVSKGSKAVETKNIREAYSQYIGILRPINSKPGNFILEGKEQRLPAAK